MLADFLCEHHICYCGGWLRQTNHALFEKIVPRPPASARLKRRMLAARLDALAERYVRELEADPLSKYRNRADAPTFPAGTSRTGSPSQPVQLFSV